MCANSIGAGEILTEFRTGVGIAMVTDNRPRFRIHCLDVIHQLTTVAMSTETIDGDDIASDADHVSVATIIDWNFGKAFL